VVNNEGASAIGSLDVGWERKGESGRPKLILLSCGGLGGPAILEGEVADSDSSLSNVGVQGLVGVQGRAPSGNVRGWGKLRTMWATSWSASDGGW